MTNRKKSKKFIPMTTCKARLAALWLIGAAFIFALIFAQGILGKYDYKVRVEEAPNIWKVTVENRVNEAWNWFLPIVIPTLTLILSVWAFETLKNFIGKKRKETFRKKSVKKFMFRAAYGLSLTYLVAVSLVILLSPFSSHSQLALMEQSKIWLGSFEGLTGIALGAFFVYRRK